MAVEGSSDTHSVSLGLIASSMTVLLGWDEGSVDLLSPGGENFIAATSICDQNYHNRIIFLLWEKA
jgi:hypothetical protein